ncbi:MAG: MFS transporter [Pseudonocardiales bacterium]|nr:MAG: MFS transporter [Pseudonocardiales bacterium]
MAEKVSGAAGRRSRGLARHRNFRRLWIADTASQFGTQVSVLAMPLIAVLTLKVSPQAVGILVAMEFAAFLLFGLPAGAWCDRWRRRPVMIIGDLARFLLLASVPAAYWLDVLTIWQLYVVVLLQGVATTFFDVAYQSYLPSLVPAEALIEGNAKLQGSAAVAQVSGPALAGYLIQWLTAPIAVLADAASYLFSAVNVARIRHGEPVPEQPEHRSLRREIGEGLGVVFGNPILRTLAAATAVANFFMAVFTAVIILFLARTLGLPPGAIGAAMTLGSIGAVVGAVATSPLARRFGPARSAWVPFAVGCPIGLLIPLAQRGALLVLFVLGWFGFSFAFTAYNVAGVSLRQALCPAHLLGRMNATMRFLSVGVMPFGALIGGGLASWVGPRSTLWVAMIGELLVPILLLRSPLRSMRGPAPAPAETVSQGESAPPFLEARASG